MRLYTEPLTSSGRSMRLMRTSTMAMPRFLRDATKVKGDGDAQAAAIYAQAYSQDPEFFSFYRSLAAYRKSFADGKGVLVLKPDSEFLRYLNDGPGRAR